MNCAGEVVLGNFSSVRTKAETFLGKKNGGLCVGYFYSSLIHSRISRLLGKHFETNVLYGSELHRHSHPVHAKERLVVQYLFNTLNL